jgi:hypothetical protein
MGNNSDSGSAEGQTVFEKQPGPVQDVEMRTIPLDAVPKTRWERSWPIIACGAGLFSDGYLNGVSRSSPSAGADRPLRHGSCR